MTNENIFKNALICVDKSYLPYSHAALLSDKSFKLSDDNTNGNNRDNKDVANNGLSYKSFIAYCVLKKIIQDARNMYHKPYDSLFYESLFRQFNNLYIEHYINNLVEDCIYRDYRSGNVIYDTDTLFSEYKNSDDIENGIQKCKSDLCDYVLLGLRELTHNGYIKSRLKTKNQVIQVMNKRNKRNMAHGTDDSKLLPNDISLKSIYSMCNSGFGRCVSIKYIGFPILVYDESRYIQNENKITINLKWLIQCLLIPNDNLTYRQRIKLFHIMVYIMNMRYAKSDYKIAAVSYQQISDNVKICGTDLSYLIKILKTNHILYFDSWGYKKVYKKNQEQESANSSKSKIVTDNHCNADTGILQYEHTRNFYSLWEDSITIKQMKALLTMNIKANNTETNKNT